MGRQLTSQMDCGPHEIHSFFSVLSPNTMVSRFTVLESCNGEFSRRIDSFDIQNLSREFSPWSEFLRSSSTLHMTLRKKHPSQVDHFTQKNCLTFFILKMFAFYPKKELDLPWGPPPGNGRPHSSSQLPDIGVIGKDFLLWQLQSQIWPVKAKYDVVSIVGRFSLFNVHFAKVQRNGAEVVSIVRRFSLFNVHFAKVQRNGGGLRAQYDFTFLISRLLEKDT